MFNEFKIVKHWHSSDPDDFIYRVMRRQYLFFWSYESAHSSIENAKHRIACTLEEEARVITNIRETPRDEIVYTV